MRTLVSKWANSLGLRIPKSVAAEANVKDGDTVEVTVHDGAIIVRPQRNRYTLEELVAGITPNNRHKETDWGKPVGKEVCETCVRPDAGDIVWLTFDPQPGREQRGRRPALVLSSRLQRANATRHHVSRDVAEKGLPFRSGAASLGASRGSRSRGPCEES